MGKQVDGEKRFGPFRWGKVGWNPIRLVLSSGDNWEEKEDPNLTIYAFGWAAKVELPRMIRHYRVKTKATTWNAETIARIGRDWYYSCYPREYGFSLHEGFLQVFYGVRREDGSGESKEWSCFLPWTQWRLIRRTFFTPAGDLFCHIDEKADFDKVREVEKAVPKISFEVQDYDGTKVVATCFLKETEYKLGTGYFKWISLFRKSRIWRSVDINFSTETGKEKGSWKGGVLGTGCEALPHENCEDAFKRFCQQEHYSKYGSYRLKFLGRVDAL